MPISDSELERMVKNLKEAFADASDAYESKQRYYGRESETTRKSALEMATISEAYLRASREQEDRKTERDASTLPGKTLKAPGATP